MNGYMKMIKNKIKFLQIEGNSERSSCKVISEEGLPHIFEEMRKPLVIYDFAAAPSEFPYI